MSTPTDDKARRQELAAECEDRLARVRTLIDGLAAEINPLVTRYGELVGLARSLGGHERAPDVREDIAQSLRTRLGALWPFVPLDLPDLEPVDHVS